MVFRSCGGRAAILLALLAYAGPALAQATAPSGYTNTLKWYHRQAEAGDARAQFLLGIKFETGTDVPLNLERAADWFERAARQDFPDAQFKYATMLEAGRGRAIDRAKAETWYRAAALRAHAPAQFNLGVMLINRAQSDDDVAEALSWLIRAADSGLAPAQALVARLSDVHTGKVLENARNLARVPLATVANGR